MKVLLEKSVLRWKAPQSKIFVVAEADSERLFQRLGFRTRQTIGIGDVPGLEVHLMVQDPRPYEAYSDEMTDEDVSSKKDKKKKKKKKSHRESRRR